jgi:hypothetical protein
LIWSWARWLPFVSHASVITTVEVFGQLEAASWSTIGMLKILSPGYLVHIAGMA